MAGATRACTSTTSSADLAASISTILPVGGIRRQPRGRGHPVAELR